MTRFRPCIDLHQGRVKQIVGGSLDAADAPQTNFISENAPAWFAERYRRDGLRGGHVIQLGPGNRDAAREALAAWPNGLQLGGGVNDANANEWLGAGAEKLIVTSWLFDENARFQWKRLETLANQIGPEKLVIDLSCRDAHPEWRVAMNRWQTPTDLYVSPQTLTELADFCSEFLIHAADVEGLRGGMDDDLIRMLGDHCPLPVTYAGGAARFEDLAHTEALSGGRVDLTIGSALDLFGGNIPYADCVAWNERRTS
ncbi:MAG: phosphoribosylformimino-5-aminoimidazole carboxamide ribotide isomerase [Verrucomicrobia bacterium]|nr:phosphoribosylformimino-5-aminoimidazole carboxamide ribotide isomerase [Verrucomicrobiota bacterium]MCH8512614.1 phosphoribosylformimino-5-aminoimidazole carboxamide ribotide isomerase [Kiritimatiellia bacterium]